MITEGSINEKFKTGTNATGSQTVSFNTGNPFLFKSVAFVTTPCGTVFSAEGSGTAGICLAAGTLVSLSDGTNKPIEDITYDDRILVWDFDLGRLAESRPLWIKRPETIGRYNLLEFSDGTTLRTINQHRIFNKQAGRFTYPMTDETPIGTVTFNRHGQEIVLVCKSVVVEDIDYYNVITDHHMNLFADSVLTSCRLNNIYPVADMKFVKEHRAARPRKEFTGIPDRFFTGLRLSEQAIGRDEIIWYVRRLMKLELSRVERHEQQVAAAIG